MKVRKEVKWFSELMEEKLKKNDHKGGWRDGDSTIDGYLIYRLQDEVDELKEKLRIESWVEPDGIKKITEECADVANFAMMIADLLTKPKDNG